MKLTYFGTAAAEGFPALFCNCEYCREARRLGGKNIRTRSQSLINEDMLIDFPADSYMHFLMNGTEADKIKYLLITHSHQDHFYQEDLFIRYSWYAHSMRVPVLRVFCSEGTYKTLEKLPENVEFTVMRPFEPVEAGGYKITAFPAKHMHGSEGAEPFIYMIEEGNKTLLYAHDTGYFFDSVFDYVEKNNVFFDMISLDCTNMDIPESDDGGHMGYPNIERVMARLQKIGAINEKTVKYFNHFSHNGNPIHSVLEARAAEYGCLVSYDGCRVEF